MPLPYFGILFAFFLVMVTQMTNLGKAVEGHRSCDGHISNLQDVHGFWGLLKAVYK